MTALAQAHSWLASMEITQEDFETEVQDVNIMLQRHFVLTPQTRCSLFDHFLVFLIYESFGGRCLAIGGW